MAQEWAKRHLHKECAETWHAKLKQCEHWTETQLSLDANNMNIPVWRKTNCGTLSLSCFQWSDAEGGLDYHWDSCIKAYNQVNKVRVQENSASNIRLLAHYKVDYILRQMSPFNESHLLSLVPLSPADCAHIHTPPMHPTISFTSCPTAVGAMGLRASFSCALVRPSRCHFCSPTCWLRQRTTLMCCCSHICPAGMSSRSTIFR